MFDAFLNVFTVIEALAIAFLGFVLGLVYLPSTKMMPGKVPLPATILLFGVSFQLVAYGSYSYRGDVAAGVTLAFLCLWLVMAAGTWLGLKAYWAFKQHQVDQKLIKIVRNLIKSLDKF